MENIIIRLIIPMPLWPLRRALRQRQLLESVEFEGGYHSYARKYGYILRERRYKGPGRWVRRAIRIFFVSALLGHWHRWRGTC